jgi:hypothetical protein
MGGEQGRLNHAGRRAAGALLPCGLDFNRGLAVGAARHMLEGARLAASLLEIVELASGEFVLRRPGGDGEPLVRIRFSPESREYLSDARLDVAKAMIEAGIQTAAQLAGGEAELEFVGAREDGGRVLH